MAIFSSAFLISSVSGLFFSSKLSLRASSFTPNDSIALPTPESKMSCSPAIDITLRLSSICFLSNSFSKPSAKFEAPVSNPSTSAGLFNIASISAWLYFPMLPAIFVYSSALSFKSFVFPSIPFTAANLLNDFAPSFAALITLLS